MRNIALAGACIVLAAQLGACDGVPLFTSDLDMARSAILERNWPLAERLLERYLHDEHNPEKRFEAWQMLLNVLDSVRPENRASLDYLEAMLEEFSDDDGKSARILEKLGMINERMRRFREAENAWSTYVGLAGLDDSSMVRGFRHLAAMQLAQRKFQASEDSLEQCVALDIPEGVRLVCLLDMADLFMALERWQEMAGICRQVLDSNPADAERGLAGFMLGDALEQLGRKDEALAQFEEVIDIYPNPEVIRNRIAHLRAKMKRQPEK